MTALRTEHRSRSLARCACMASILAAFALTVPGMAAPVQCPPHLEVKQTATNLPPGLQAFDAAPKHVWTNAEFSDGTPDQQAWLAPDSSRRDGKGFLNTWRFASSGEGIWLSCAYTGTSLVATFRLPATVRTCEVRFEANVSPPSATSLTCR